MSNKKTHFYVRREELELYSAITGKCSIPCKEIEEKLYHNEKNAEDYINLDINETIKLRCNHNDEMKQFKDRSIEFMDYNLYKELITNNRIITWTITELYSED